MKTIETSGASVEAAVETAVRELGIRNRTDVEVEVLEDASEGFLGLIGQREARVRVRVKEGKRDFCRTFVKKITEYLKMEAEVEAEESNERIVVNVSGSDLGLLIGHHGQTLNALQYLINIAAARVSRQPKKVVLDAEGYRDRRRRTLKRLAERLGRKAARSGEEVSLEPMPASERKIIHTTLQDDPSVSTRSRGDEPFRKVIITPQ